MKSASWKKRSARYKIVILITVILVFEMEGAVTKVFVASVKSN